MKTAESILNQHCFTGYNKNSGEDEVESSVSSVVIAMEEYAEQIEEDYKEHRKNTNDFILEIASMIKMDTDGIGFDGITFNLEDFEEKIEQIKKERDYWKTRCLASEDCFGIEFDGSIKVLDNPKYYKWQDLKDGGMA